MLIDLNQHKLKPSPARYDVAVCGTGPAGLTVARTLAAAGKSVLLLEAGGFESSDASQDIYAGEESGLQAWNAIRNCRLRYFGGTSGHWTGMCGVFSEAEFESSRYHELPGWPISLAELLKELPQAASILDLPAADFAMKPLLATAGPLRTVQVQMSPPTRFGTKYRQEVVGSGRIQLLLNANVTEVVLQGSSVPQAAVDHLVVKTYSGDVIPIAADRFVLALGAIENARLLLNSNRQRPEGLGNHSDFVGRCFMEHLNVSMGRFVARHREVFSAEGVLRLNPTDELTRTRRIGGGILSLSMNYQPQDYGRTAAAKGVVRAAACKSDTVRDYLRSFKDFDCPGDGVITTMIEQAPNRASRVTLAASKDGLGQRRAHLNWVIDDADRRTIRMLGQTVAEAAAKQDFARVQLAPSLLDPGKPIELANHCHHMGTTRMSHDPRFGVVDENARVHGLSNLYVAGGSVFATGGGINPTLTIVMLSLRLGRHLAGLA